MFAQMNGNERLPRDKWQTVRCGRALNLPGRCECKNTSAFYDKKRSEMKSPDINWRESHMDECREQRVPLAGVAVIEIDINIKHVNIQ